jgi:hypothetical protein
VKLAFRCREGFWHCMVGVRMCAQCGRVLCVGGLCLC